MAHYSEGELERVRRIARSYKFSVEFAGPLTSPEVTDHPDAPGPHAVDVNEAKVVPEEPPSRRRGPSGDRVSGRRSYSRARAR